MIKRFRIEGEGASKEGLADELAAAGARIIGEISRSETQPRGEWECTDDFLHGASESYKGRMVFRFHGDKND